MWLTASLSACRARTPGLCEWGVVEVLAWNLWFARGVGQGARALVLGSGVMLRVACTGVWGGELGGEGGFGGGREQVNTPTWSNHFGTWCPPRLGCPQKRVGVNEAGDAGIMVVYRIRL
ncbi:hypothetical protein Tco_0669627 [Tanacetum coccineum]